MTKARSTLYSKQSRVREHIKHTKLSIIIGVKFIQYIQETFKEKKLEEDVMLFYAQELVVIFECLEDCGFICR